MPNEEALQEIIDELPQTRRREALQKIIRHNNSCKIWIGGSECDRYDYPYRLIPVDGGGQRIRECSYELMLDSSIGDPSITNKTVIEKAIEYDAQWVVPKDYWGEIDKTHESIKEFLNLYEKSNCRSNIMVPIQPPHDEHYYRYEDFYSKFSHFAVGGVKQADPSEQVEAVKIFREAVGPRKWVHGLGMGCSEDMIEALRNCQPFLDSLDVSTFERLPGQCGKIADKNWKQNKFNFPSGKEISTLNARIMEYHAYQANFQLTKFDNEFPENNTEIPEPDQSTLNESWATPRNSFDAD